MRDVVIYTGNYFYPDGNAAGKRVLGNLEAINAAGFETVCLCFRKDTSSQEIMESKFNNTALYTIPYTLGKDRLNNKKPEAAFLTVLKKYENKIKCVIMYNSLGTTEFNSFVIRMCNKNKVKVCYDIVDYFEKPAKNNLLRYLMKKRELDKLTGKVIPACDGWIAISEYLKGMMPNAEKTIVVPPLAVNSLTKDEEYKPQSDITFSYATYIVDKNRPISEWKDRIDTIVDIFYAVYLEGMENFRIKFLGFTKDELIGMFPDELKSEYSEKLNKMSGKFFFMGKMENLRVQEELQKSDFTILLRDKSICNTAGFPTKVSESVSVGTPVFLNLTSDIGKYLSNGKNAIIVPDPQHLDQIVVILKKVLSMTKKERVALKRNTKFEQPFMYTEYVDLFRDFIKAL